MSQTPMTPQHDRQEDLIAFVSDPETIKKAVEGSMNKRLKVLAQHDRDELMGSIIASVANDYADQLKYDAPYINMGADEFASVCRAFAEEDVAELLKSFADRVREELLSKDGIDGTFSEWNGLNIADLDSQRTALTKLEEEYGIRGEQS